MVFKYHIKEIILSFLLIFMLFVNIVLVFDNIPYCHSQLTKRIIRLRVYKSNAINHE